MESAERGEIAVYTVSTVEYAANQPYRTTGERALQTLSEKTGGAAFFPSSLSGLKRRLADLQEVIRSRYMISYRPAEFKPDGHYRPIALTAEKSGRKLRVYARRGYYAKPRTTE